MIIRSLCMSCRRIAAGLFGAKNPQSFFVRTDCPCPIWSWPTTRTSCSARYRAKGSYRSINSVIPWMICRIALQFPDSGTQRTACTGVRPSFDIKVNSTFIFFRHFSYTQDPLKSNFQSLTSGLKNLVSTRFFNLSSPDGSVRGFFRSGLH